MGDDSISFTRHAEEMLAERNIERAWVERTIRDPEEVENDERPGAVRAYRAIPERDGRVLRVVYSKKLGRNSGHHCIFRSRQAPLSKAS